MISSNFFLDISKKMSTRKFQTRRIKSQNYETSENFPTFFLVEIFWEWTKILREHCSLLHRVKGFEWYMVCKKIIALGLLFEENSCFFRVYGLPTLIIKIQEPKIVPMAVPWIYWNSNFHSTCKAQSWPSSLLVLHDFSVIFIKFGSWI